MKKEILKNTTVKVDKSFDPFSYQNLFYEYELEINNDEVNQVLLLTKNINSIEQKNTFNYLNVLNFPVLKNLRKQVIDILDKHKLILSNNWSQFYNKNERHMVHVHNLSVYSGIIYLNGNNASPTVFYDRFFEPYFHEFKKNKLLMFPSMIPHEVKPLKNNEERLVISFNTKKA